MATETELEQLLGKAILDSDFRRKLLEDPQGAACKAGIDLSATQAAAIGNLGLVRIYQESDRVDEALEAWSMAVVLNPEIGANVSAIYAWLIERGDLERAETYLNREQEPLRRTFYRGLLDWQAGRHDAARKKWRDVVFITACLVAILIAIFPTDRLDGTEATVVSVFVFFGYAYVISQRFLRSPVSFIAHECDACGRIIYGDSCPYCEGPRRPRM